MLGKNEIREILKSRFANDRHTKISEIPLPCELKDTYKAALRIKTAIEENQRIAVVGDYDVDGIVSTVIMSDFFNQIGADYVIKIPNRFTDGYGLNSEIIGELEDVDLIITVDNGTSATEAAEICAQKGIDLIITDHHMPPPVLPRAYAIINPKQPDCTFPNIEICGAQVAWYLVGALKETLGVNYDMASSMDILIIAIIADMMELRDMNRALLRFGIKRLNSSNRACFNLNSCGESGIDSFYGLLENSTQKSRIAHLLQLMVLLLIRINRPHHLQAQQDAQRRERNDLDSTDIHCVKGDRAFRF